MPASSRWLLISTTRPVRASQRDSRRLARATFLRSSALCCGRDVDTRYMPARSMTGSILAAMHERGV